MLNKLLLNNQIISNKKKIQQARVQTINKLVQKIRKLKDLSKKYPDKANIDSNLTKIPLILACVKKLKASDIIRKVLTLHKKPAAVLTNGQAKPEDVAVALLATNKIIDDITSTLKLTLHLNDTNPGWKNEIMELSKKKRFLLKNAERKQQKKSVNKFKTPSPKTKPTWKEENVDDNGTDSTKAPEDVVQSNGWKVEPVEKILESASEPARKTPKTVSKPRVELQKTERTLEARYDGSPAERSPSPVDQKTVTTIDSFFFTTSGDNYVSSVAFKEKQPDGPNDGLDRRERRKHQRRSHHNDDRQMRPSYNKRRSDVPQSNPRLREKPFERQQSLHPSWAAKQKMNPAAVEFKGRKITFGDDSTEGNLGKSSEKRSKKSNTPAQTPDQSSEKLHPSWAAKQKLKPTITEFKGTKITFDD